MTPIVRLGLLAVGSSHNCLFLLPGCFCVSGGPFCLGAPLMLDSPNSVCFLLVTHPIHFFSLFIFLSLFLINPNKKFPLLGQSPTQQTPIGLWCGGMGEQGSALTLARGWWALVCLSFSAYIACPLGRVGEFPVRFPRNGQS